MKHFIFKSLFFVCFCAYWIIGYSQLPVPSNLVSFDSKQGQELFYGSKHKSSYWKLSEFFISQKGLTWCAIASDVMVLNALGVTPPVTPEEFPYGVFTQNNFFGPAQLKITAPAKVYNSGMTLDDNAKLLQSYDLAVEIIHTNENSSQDQFRKTAIAALSSNNKFILVNFCREIMGETGCGHFSPLAAYNQSADKFLILDVARYKYPPVWISTKELYKSMHERIDSSSNLHRGYLVVSKH